MTASIGFDPYTTTNASGLFTAQSDGFVQGVAQDDPVYRDWLQGGILATTETLPMWGGVALYINQLVSQVPLANDSSPLGYTVGRATSVTVGAAGQYAGFSVYNQSYANPITTNNNVPLAASGGPVNFFQAASHARIAVAVDPTLITALANGSILQQVSWDYINQRLTTYAPAYTAGTLTGATWASTSGGRITYTGVSQDYTALLAANDYVTITGVVSTGATTNGYNGTWQVVSLTSTTIVVAAPMAASPGAYASGGAIAAGGGALPCKVLQVQSSNCKTVAYNAALNSANWNNNGAVALIQI